MTAFYDHIADEYEDILKLPVAKHIDEYSYLSVLGDIDSKSTLDFGCGEGIYTRKFKQKGAGRVVGVDVSEKLIEKARLKESQERLGIEYIVYDGINLGEIGSFDLVGSSFALSVAQNKEQLLNMSRNISANLKSGGRFVCIIANPDQSPDTYQAMKKYGFIKSISEPLQEGVLITYTHVSSGAQLHDYYHSRATYEWALRTAGFKEIRWLPIMVSPEGVKEFGEEFWQDCLTCELVVVIECFK